MNWGGRLFEDRRTEQGSSFSVKGALSGRHLIEHQAKGEQVRSRVKLLATQLLRRHITGRADRRPRAREGGLRIPFLLLLLRRKWFCLDLSFFGSLQFSQAEVQNLDLAVDGYKNVGRFDVAMDDAFTVRGRQALGGLHRKFEI